MKIGLLLMLVYMFCAAENKFFGGTYTQRPIVAGALTGLVMGDFKMGLFIGGTLELTWMGFLPYAGMITGETTAGAILGTYFAIATGSGYDVALTIALPAAIVIAQVKTAFYTIGSYVMHVCDKWAANGEFGKINVFHICFGFVNLLIFGGLVGLTVTFGTDAIVNLINIIPESIRNGMSCASNVLPAVGFAMLLNIMWDKRFVPLFFVGFVAASYLGMDVMSVTIVTLAIAIAVHLIKKGDAVNE